jgi:hypothetical protein
MNVENARHIHRETEKVGIVKNTSMSHEYVWKTRECNNLYWSFQSKSKFNRTANY